MSYDPFVAEISKARQQLAALQERCAESPSDQRDLLKEFLGSFSTTLDRLQVVGQARQHADEMAAVFAALVQPVMLIGPEGEILRANPAAVAALGYDPAGLPELVLAEKIGARHPNGGPIAAGELLGVRALQGATVLGEHQSLVTSQGVQHDLVLSAAPIVTAGRISGAVVSWHDVTELRRAEAALRESEEKLAAFFEFLPVGLAVMDRERHILIHNPALVDILALPKDSLRRGTYETRRYLRADGSEMPLEEFPSVRAFREQRAMRNVEVGVVKEDGERIWTSVSATPLPFSDWRTAVVTADITHHKQVEEHLWVALSESRKRQREISALLAGARLVLRQHTFADSARSIFESCRDLTGAQGGYIALRSGNRLENDVVYLDAGGIVCTVDPALPMPIRGLRARVYSTGKGIIENDFTDSELADLMPAGHVPVRTVLFAPLTLSGEVVGLLGLANKPGGFDEDDLRMAEAFGELAAIALQNSRLTESLEASEKRFRAVLETANAAIVTADGGGRVVSWNRMAEVMFGYAATEMVGTPLHRIIPERLRKPHADGMGRALLTGGTRLSGDTLESVGERKDGSEFPLEMALATWRTAEGSSFSAIMHDITERKRVEEALRRANESIEAVIRASPLAIVTLDAELKVRLWNPAAEQIFGWSESELLGRPYPLVPDSRQGEYEELLQELWGGRPLSGYETQRQRRDGELLEVSLWTSPLRNPDGQIDGLLAILNDITHRKQAEAELQRYAGEQAALYAITSAVSVTLDPDRLLPTVFDSVLPLLGADAGWILLPGTRPDGPPRVVAWRDDLEPVSDGETLRPLRDCPVYGDLLAGEGYAAEPRLVVACPLFPARTSEGFARCVCVPLGVSGNVLGVLKLGWRQPRPVTDPGIAGREQRLLSAIGRQVGMALHNAQLYQAARQLNRLKVLAALDEAVAATLDPRRVAEETLEHVATGLDAVGVMVLLPRPADPAGRGQVFALMEGWRTVELPADEATGWQGVVSRLAPGRDIVPLPAEELAGMHPADVYPHGDIARHWGRHGVAIAVRAKRQLRAVLALGGRPDHQPFTDEDRALALVAASHAGQAIQNAQLYVALKDMLTERDQTRAQLVQSEKLSALGRLVASLTHEINNPLQSVQGCLSLLEEELGAEHRPDKMIRYLGVVQEEIERIATIVRRMREFTRPAREELVYVDLRAVAESVLDLSSKQLEHSRVGVEREWEPELPPVEANADHLKQVFLNLLLNAIDAMPDGGTLRIVLAEDQMPPGGDRPAGPALRTDFIDTGEGMSAAVQSRLFEPFFTTKEQGAGLGLTICYGIIRGHHGAIVVRSEEGAGSTFSVFLPVTQP